ncbi:MAG: alpha/beta fold hydrolase [Chitinophagaceae bacterium]|nr:MAG: alpha/beta fold hydrolase [Chitinophagaceae bacterium]
MKYIFYFTYVLLLFVACNTQPSNSVKDYFNYNETGVKTAGVKMIPIKTPVGTFNVWTKRFGNNPRIKVLLLHGGPASTHEYLEAFESFFPQEGFEFYEYDQLGSYYSDQPTDSSLWTIDHFVEEVEQVRVALGLTNDNFYLYGNSWGGILAMEYAFKYQDNLKGLIISNMMSSCPDYGKYANEVLSKQMKPEVLAEIRNIEAKQDFANPRYMELLLPNFYKEHLCRLEEWPDAVNRSFKHSNSTIYTMMQGPSEFGVGGRLVNWDRSKDLPQLKIPTLTIGAQHDTMDPKHMEWMSTQVQNGRYLFCPNGSHLSMWDDQAVFFNGLINFINDVDKGKMDAIAKK